MSEYTPITGELRTAMRQWGWVEKDGSITFTSSSMPPSIDAEQSLAIRGSDFDRHCDAIDSIHANLERENASLKAELDRLMGEQEEHAHTMGESITSELRKVAAKTECANGRCEKLYRGDIDHIADRIDVEHEKAMAAAALIAGVPITDEHMAKQGWIRLPVDADGEPWHIGDVTESGQTVTGMGLNRHGWCFTGTVNEIDPALHRHHAPDTWERIIADARTCTGSTGNYTSVPTMRWTNEMDALVARCRALAGDAS